MRFKKMPPRAIHLRNVKVKLVYFANRVFWIALSAILALQVPRFGDYLALIGALVRLACSSFRFFCPVVIVFIHG
eukprot:m.320649 g.320649  ORF g.320649 m.320649 type:complete len:75 (-) comp20324_c0_seq10:2506-2730(-)